MIFLTAVDREKRKKEFFDMSSAFSVQGPLKTKFLLCSASCNDCKRNICLNEQKMIELLETVTFQLPDHNILEINAGFQFDGASIPKICWTSIGHPLEHRFILAALLHDALYLSQYLKRETADQYFYDFLKDFSGVGTCTAWKMHTGVRLFGGKAWKEKTESQIAWARKIITLTGDNV